MATPKVTNKATATIRPQSKFFQSRRLVNVILVGFASAFNRMITKYVCAE